MSQSTVLMWAQLLDEGIYWCSWRTMYRLLEAEEEVRERRNQRRHPSYTKPELLATGPNQLWSWDITKLKGPAKWVYYYINEHLTRLAGIVTTCTPAQVLEDLLPEQAESPGDDA